MYIFRLYAGRAQHLRIASVWPTNQDNNNCCCCSCSCWCGCCCCFCCCFGSCYHCPVIWSLCWYNFVRACLILARPTYTFPVSLYKWPTMKTNEKFVLFPFVGFCFCFMFSVFVVFLCRLSLGISNYKYVKRFIHVALVPRDFCLLATYHIQFPFVLPLLSIAFAWYQFHLVCFTLGSCL